MHLKIKTSTEVLRANYENHTTYHEGDSGLDLFVPEDILVPGGSIGFKIDHGISCEPFTDRVKNSPTSYYLYPRSSMGANTPLRLSNSVGIIDSGYRGSIIAIVDNITEDDFLVKAGTRIIQLCDTCLKPITFQLVDNLSETTRGVGGLGSTG
jgi:dUTP pyrophosphatase